MSRMILGVKLASLLVWTGLSFGAYVLLDLVGDAIIRNAGILPIRPEALEFLSRVLNFLQQVGFGFVVFGWLCGVAAILVVGWLVHRLARRRRIAPARYREPLGPEPLPRR